MIEECQILTDSMLAGLPDRLRLVGSGKHQRAGCPFHGSDHSRSLELDGETGRFYCHNCHVWGYHEKWNYKVRKGAERARGTHSDGGGFQRPKAMRPGGTLLRLVRDAPEPEPLPADWLRRFTELRARLPEAAEYLASRRMPLELVRELGGAVGYFGGAKRLLLPHTDPQGRIVSVYGRRIDGGEEHKHHHIAGRAKGAFNAQACNGAEVWITEAPFDALALMNAGISHAVAFFGVKGIRWKWLKGVRRIVLAFDMDEAGRKAIAEHGKQALMRGIEVLAVTPDELGGAKDIAEAWAAGTLHLASLPPLMTPRAAAARQPPPEPPW